MMKPMIFVGLAALLIACSGSTPRLDMAHISSELRLRAAVSTAIIRTVSLPTYAAAEELSIETDDGLISADNGILWADDPARAVTLALAHQIGDITRAKVGPDPWPFVGLPDVAVDVRVTRMITGVDGMFDFEGQFFVGGDGIDYPSSTNSFAYQMPVTTATPAGIAQAQARALLALSEKIARKIAR